MHKELEDAFIESINHWERLVSHVLEKDVIAPGEALEMSITFNSAGRRGNQQKSITIYSNDPVTPVQRVTVKAIVQIENN